MAKHLNQSMRFTESQWRFGLNAEELVLRAARYADENGLWQGSKAKVPVEDWVGVLGNGERTHIINVYRKDNGMVHGCPGTNRPW
jgi:hypothetical protein